jgi:hypothetical protein
LLDAPHVVGGSSCVVEVAGGVVYDPLVSSVMYGSYFGNAGLSLVSTSSV